MRYAIASALAIAASVSAAPQQAVTSSVTPSESAPAGCMSNYDGTFQIQVVNVTTSSKVKRQSSDGQLMITLNDGTLKDNQDRTGYIAANSQFQFDGPPQAGALFTAGWSVCSNGSLAIGGSSIFYQCLSGDFYNLYKEAQAAQCSPIYINVIGSSGAGAGAVQTIGDGQVTGSAVATQISDGQIQATSAAQISQISDGQIQATTAASPIAPVTQISDGQLQAPTSSSVVAAPVTQISDGQIQAPTSSSAVVSPISQIGDGQIQAPTGNMTVMPTGTGVYSAPSGTGSPIPQYTGAANALTVSGAGFLALFGLMAAL